MALLFRDLFIKDAARRGSLMESDKSWRVTNSEYNGLSLGEPSCSIGSPKSKRSSRNFCMKREKSFFNLNQRGQKGGGGGNQSKIKLDFRKKRSFGFYLVFIKTR